MKTFKKIDILVEFFPTLLSFTSSIRTTFPSAGETINDVSEGEFRIGSRKKLHEKIRRNPDIKYKIIII